MNEVEIWERIAARTVALIEEHSGGNPETGGDPEALREAAGLPLGFHVFCWEYARRTGLDYRTVLMLVLLGATAARERIHGRRAT